MGSLPHHNRLREGEHQPAQAHSVLNTCIPFSASPLHFLYEISIHVFPLHSIPSTECEGSQGLSCIDSVLYIFHKILTGQCGILACANTAFRDMWPSFLIYEGSHLELFKTHFPISLASVYESLFFRFIVPEMKFKIPFCGTDFLSVYIQSIIILTFLDIVDASEINRGEGSCPKRHRREKHTHVSQNMV